MFKRTDEGDTVVGIAADYYRAMVNADADSLRQVFHPKAQIIGTIDSKLDVSSLEVFIADTPDANTGVGPFDYHVDGVTLLGDTAVVTVSGYCYSAWFTDHLSMVKNGGRWQIVSKTYYQHP